MKSLFARRDIGPRPVPPQPPTPREIHLVTGEVLMVDYDDAEFTMNNVTSGVNLTNGSRAVINNLAIAYMRYWS